MCHLVLFLLLGACGSGSKSGSDDSSTASGDDSAAVTDADGDGVSPPADCDDNDESVHPNATEIIADGKDQDCDGKDLCYLDSDWDGYGGDAALPSPSCAFEGVAPVSADCDDTDATVHPGAKEIPIDAVDQDCDGREMCYVDSDGDGFGSSMVWLSQDLDCADAGEAGNADDCLDVGKDAAATFPGAAEIDSQTDCMLDFDQDGRGSSAPAEGVVPGTDCDDHDSGPCPAFHVGNDTEFAASSNTAPDYLLGSRLEVTTPMTVTDLALIGKDTGANIRMALYTDAKGPDALVVEGPSTAMVVGVLEMPVDPTPIAAGSYWIMAVYDADASVGISFPSKGGDYKYRSLSYTDPMPDPCATLGSGENQIYNYYIVGYY